MTYTFPGTTQSNSYGIRTIVCYYQSSCIVAFPHHCITSFCKYAKNLFIFARINHLCSLHVVGAIIGFLFVSITGINQFTSFYGFICLISCAVHSKWICTRPNVSSQGYLLVSFIAYFSCLIVKVLQDFCKTILS